MKKFIWVLITAMSATVELYACDICGCGVGSNYVGILPDFKKKIVGLRYRMSALTTHVGINGASSYLTTTERYDITEAWVAINISKKMRLMAVVPYNFNQRKNSNGTGKKDGLGDVAIYSFYQLLNSKKSTHSNRLLLQSLWLGAGLKLPTGRYEPSDKSVNNDANVFQLGSGSVDFSVQLMYDIRLQDIGINVNSMYKMNSFNKQAYRYGNKFSLVTQLYHKFRIGKESSIAPNGGIAFEHSKKDLESGRRMDVSGGTMLAAMTGVEVSCRRVMAGLNFQQPVRQDLANGLIKSKNKAMAHIAFTL